MSVTVAFRCDGSPAIGSGHVVRCLAIAHALREAGGEAIFAMRDLGGGFVDMAMQAGFATKILGVGPASEIDDAAQTATAIGSADWVVADNYALARDWERALRPKAARIAALADRDRRVHDADLLIDPNLGAVPADYTGRVPAHCEIFTGPAYAPLRAQFAAARGVDPVRRLGLRRLLICMGGSDPANATAMAVEGALRARKAADFAIEIVLGGAYPHRAAIEALCAGHRNIEIAVAVDDMARRMARADLFVGSGGSMTWERATVGLPGITIAIADNQVPLGVAIAKAGADLYLGSVDTVSVDDFAAAIAAFARTPALLEGHSARVAPICDGGGAARIVAALLSEPVQVRPAQIEDRDSILAWRNDPEVRANSNDIAPIPADAHARWFAKTLADRDRPLLIGRAAGVDIGVVRYDIAQATARVSVFLARRPDGAMPSGIGARLLRAGEAWLRAARPDVKSFEAEIRTGNMRSAGAFARAGFRDAAALYVKRIDGENDADS